MRQHHPATTDDRGRAPVVEADDDQEAILLFRRCIGSDDPRLWEETLARLEQLSAPARPAPLALFLGGYLLWHRCTQTEDRADLDEAVRRLEAAATAVPEAQQAAAWTVLGLALFMRWMLDGAVTDRDRAISWLHRGLAAGLADPELRTEASTHLARTCVDALGDDPPQQSIVTAAVAALEVGTAALEQAPTDDVEARAALAMQLARLEAVLSGRPEHEDDLERLGRHLAIARRHPDPPAEWAVQLDVLDWKVKLAEDVQAGRAGGSGVEHLVAAAGAGVRPPVFDERYGDMLAVASLYGASRSGDLGKFRDAARLSAHDTSTNGRMTNALAELGLLHAQGASSNEFLAVLDRLVDVCRAQPGDAAADTLLPLLLPAREALGPTGGPRHDPHARPPGGPMADQLGRLIDRTAAVAGLSAAVTDPARRREELLELERQVADASGMERSLVAHRLVSAWLDLGDDPAAVEHAIRWGEEALRLDGGPEHPLWIQAARNTALARRRRGRPDDRLRSRELGLEILRGHAWLALVQAGTADALTTARHAATEAVRLARWCHRDRDADCLVAALDAGRALVLQAAITARGVADRLRAAGEPALAEEWTRAGGSDRIAVPGGGEVQGDLRRRVLAVLGTGRSALLDPPSAHHIRAALAAHGSDALVYLVPAGDADGADGPQPGLAVVVPAREPVELVELPDLDAVEAAALVDRAVPGAGRDLVPNVERPGDPLVDVLDWAWHAAGRRLADVADRLRDPGGAPARLVLVPFGALARVPWHAAGPRGGRSGLLDHAVVSTTPSARLLCDAVARPPRPRGGRLVVGNPTGDLRAAGAEARAIIDAFYPDATYLGSADSPHPAAARWVGSGLAGQVTARLAADAEPLALLHLACHGHADQTAPGRSHLVLADRALDVDELLALRPAALLDVGTVCLAACSTNVSGVEYDEAFSLAAAFLAAGARTVFASMWRVPDDHTSRLMFMVHHHLATDGCSPADALHRARLWARNPHRVAPDSMPADLAAGTAGMEDPVAWAGFQHLGA
jgi:CHAT domain